MYSLSDIIARALRENGVIPFARFMELALYCPVYGYYEKEPDTVGRRGDFYTNVSVGSLFGQLLAFRFAEWLAEVRSPTPLTREQASGVPSPRSRQQMVEAGAHDGRLAKDILSWLQERRSELYDGFEYVIVEPSSRRREWQVAMLGEFKDKVRWVEALGELAGDGVQGIIFSNELLDAMPVHRLGWDAANQTWFEWGVMDRDGTLAWARMDIPESKVQSPKSNVQRSTFDVPNPNPGIGVGNDASPWAPPELPAAVLNVLPDGFTTESCPAATDWWTAAAKVLRRGTLLTIDYGLTAEQFLAPERKDGTLRAYARHHQVQDLLTNAGEQDLTAHVNFSAVQSAGEAAGLKTEALVSQVTFLTQIAARIWKDPAAFGEWTPAHTRQFQTLTHPEHLGRPFRVLIQSRSVSEVNH